MTDAEIREANSRLDVIAYHERQIAEHRQRIAGHEEQIRLEREKIERLKSGAALDGEEATKR